MSIERGQAAGTAAAAGSVHGRGAAAKADAAAAGGDFLALLAALDATLPADVESAVDGAQPGPVGEADDKADPALLPAADGLVPVPVAAQVLLLTPAPLPERATRSDGPTAALAGVHTGLGADGTPPSAAPDVHPAPPPAVGGAAPAASNPGASTASGAAPSQLGLQYASVLEQMQLKQRLAAQDDVVAAPIATPVAGGRGAPAWTEARRDRAGPGTAALAVALADAPAHDAAAAPDPVRPVNAGAGARGEGAGGTPLHPQATQEFRPTVQYDNTVGQPAAPQTAAEDALADQIGYWAAQGLRGADFTVQGDADPVQVSIALTGNEARVEFRSEHAATRDWLAASTDQLRELLQREGVVLAGVSVGQQTGQPSQQSPQSSQSQRQPAEGGRRMVGGPRPVDATAASAPAASRTSAGTVDLFV